MSTKDWEKATPYAILSEHPDHWKPVEIEMVKDGESNERNQEFYQSIWKQSCLQGTGLVTNKVFQDFPRLKFNL